MADGNRVSYTQIDSKVKKVDNKVIGHEQIFLTLLQRVEVLEQERKEVAKLKHLLELLRSEWKLWSMSAIN